MTRTIGSLLAIGTVIVFGMLVWNGIKVQYQWNNQYGSYWSLADKASSLEQKSAYVDQFVAGVQGAGLNGCNDTLFFPTPDNSFDQNMVALVSLQTRLKDIQSQDPSSLGYAQSIQQITSQEQDDNGAVISVVEDCWYKQNHYFWWNDFENLGAFIGIIILFIIGCVMVFSDGDDSSY